MSNTALVSNLYFTCEAYNNGSTNIPAQEDTSLLYPLIPNRESQDYQLAVAKCRVPLGTIPLTNENIGLKLYELTLRNGTFEASSYVKQVNSLTGNFYYVLDGTTIKRYSYTSTGSTLSKTIQLNNICSFVYQFVVDDYENIYIAGSNISSEIANQLIIIDSNIVPNILYQESFDNIKSIYIDRNSNFYLINENGLNAIVNCYNNKTLLNNVSLALNFTIKKDFAGNDLINAIFVVATENNIIIAHNLKMLSYYTATGIAITDYSIPGNQLVSANVLASEDILMTADINQLNDELFGVKNTLPYNIETGELLSNGLLDSELAIAGKYSYAIGTDNHLYVMDWPVISPPGNFYKINNDNLQTLAGRKDNILACTSTTDDLFFLNQNIPYNATPSNALGLTAVNFKPTSFPIFSMDWNVSNDKLLVVDSQKELYISNTGIYPLGFIGFGNTGNNIEIQGYENYDNANNQMTTHLLNSNSSVLLTGPFATKNGVVYGIKGDEGFQKVYEMNLNFDETGVIFPCTECNGDINSIDIVDNNICVVGVSGNIALYSIFNQTLTRNITNYEGSNIINFVGFQDGSRLAINHNNNLAIWNYLTGVIYSDQIIQNSFACQSITFNPNDLTNGVGKLFVSYLAGASDNKLDFITFNSSYVVDNQQNIDSSTDIFEELWFNVDNGILINYISTYAKLYYQSQNYSAQIYNTVSVPSYVNLYFPQSLTGLYTFTKITTNINPLSVAVSRTNTNTLYALNFGDNLVYSGTLVNNTITFTQLTQFNQTYSYISTTKNINTNIDSTLRTFTISNQTPIANVVISNNKVESIAKNEETAQFLVGLYTSNQIVSYNPSLVSQFTLSQNNPYSLFAKNADDINVPNVNIFNIQVVVDEINEAFVEAWNKLKGLGGNFAEPPSLSLDLNGYLTLNYSADYTQSGNAILFNNPLMNLCYFQNVPDNQDIGFYRLFLKLASTSTTQLSKSIYQFNQLDKILIESTSLFVAGSWYGRNSISQVLTDIDVPIDSSSFAIGNIGQVLYYQPPMLRVYQMASGGNAVNRIQMSILYRYRNGNQYILQLPPGEAFSVKLEFIKKF